MNRDKNKLKDISESVQFQRDLRDEWNHRDIYKDINGKVNYIKISVFGVIDLKDKIRFKHSFIIESRKMKKILRIVNKRFNYKLKYRKLKERF